MRHIILTCKNHTNLRWSCKEIAFDDEGGYNGCRNIFYKGVPDGQGMYTDRSGLSCTCFKDGKMIEECGCPKEDLIRAEEDILVLTDEERDRVEEEKESEQRIDDYIESQVDKHK